MPFGSRFFTFADEVLTRNSDVCIASLNVDALFTNIPFSQFCNFSQSNIQE